MRLDVPRDTSKHQQQAVTSTRGTMLDRGFVVRPMEQ